MSMETKSETLSIHRLLTEYISNLMNSTLSSQETIVDTDLDYYIGEHER